MAPFRTLFCAALRSRADDGGELWASGPHSSWRLFVFFWHGGHPRELRILQPGIWIGNFSQPWRTTAQGTSPKQAEKLQNLLPHVPNSFEVHELLGMTYASLSQDQKSHRRTKSRSAD